MSRPPTAAARPPRAALQTAHGVTLYAFAPARLDVWLDDGRAANNNHVVPHPAREALARSGAAAVLDGSMFRITDGARYSTSKDARVLYRVHRDADGDGRPELSHDGGTATDHRGATLSIVGGRAVVRAGDDVAPGATLALQFYPWILADGVNVADPRVNRDVTWRAGLAVLDDGDLALVVGRGTMHGFADAGRAAGARHLLYTDGGGSALLALADGTRVGSTEDRPVALWLVARAA